MPRRGMFTYYRSLSSRSEYTKKNDVDKKGAFVIPVRPLGVGVAGSGEYDVIKSCHSGPELPCFFVEALAIHVVAISTRARVPGECLFIVCKNVHMLNHRLM